MLDPWRCANLLAFEAYDVMRLRMVRLSASGSDALVEAHLMITEKTGAAIEALTTFMSGGTPLSILERYREHVAANACRLAAPSEVRVYRYPAKASD